MIKVIAAGALALAMTAGVQAQSVDPVAYEALARGNFTAAETRLESQLAKGSRDPAVLLNLAHVYKRDGRMADAAGLYREVLTARNISMELPDGSPAWSHDLAARGLARLTMLSAR